MIAEVPFCALVGAELAHDAAIRTALKTSGCIIVRDCIDPQAAADAIAATTRLFALPATEKASYLVDKGVDSLAHGFSPYGVARALDTGVPNLLETWDVSPDGAGWPPDLREEWMLVTLFERHLLELALTLLRATSKSLGCVPEALVEVTTPMRAGLHLIHYFPVPAETESGACRQSRHTDNTVVTLLPVPSPRTTGVHVFDPEDERWHEVHIFAADCVLQSGRLLEFVTNGTVRACLHTVPTPLVGTAENVSRIATPLFVSPPRDRTLAVLSEFWPGDNKTIPTVRVADVESAYFERIFGRRGAS